MPDTPSSPGDETPKKSMSGLGNLVQAESMLQLALAVPAGTFAGLLIGYLLDRHFHTKWMVVAGMLLGAAGGFIQIFTTIARAPKRGDE